ncbi:transcriptional regulator [Paenibacillus sp. 1P03SA]
MSPQRISDYCNNRFVMRLAAAKTIASELKVEIDDLYEWKRTDKYRGKR